MKNIFFGILLVIVSAFNATAQKSEVFAVDGKAIRGYDAVAFFKESKPVKGFDSLAYTYKDVQWFFSSKENLDAFKSNPEHYAPQYGGYCAYGTSQGHKAPTETDTWTVKDDKLYFNYNKEVKGIWVKDQDAFIKKANDQWPAVKEQK